MNNTSKRSCLLIAGILATTLTTQAAVISINFEGGNNSTNPTTGTAVTGTAGYIAVDNWNNLYDKTGSLSNLTDDSGSTTSASVSWGSNNVWGVGLPDSNGTDNDMMSGYLDNMGGSAITITGLNYGEYEVYCYFQRNTVTYTGLTGADNNSNTDTRYAKDIGSLYHNTGTYTISMDDSVTGDDATWTEANVIKLTGFTGSQITIGRATNPGVSNNDWKGYVQGVQVVAVPEPVTYALLAGLTGLVCVMGRRR